MDEQKPPDVRLSDPGEIAASLPYLVGFPPTESVVLIGLGGASGGLVGLTVRGELPPPEHAAAAAEELARAAATGRPDTVELVVVTEAPEVPGWAAEPDLPCRDLVRELVLALFRRGIGVREALLVRRGRWWSYDCPQPCCDPAGGTPLPAGASALAAASVAAGQVVVRDRAELVARLDRISAEDRAGVRAACLAVAGARATRGREAGRPAVAEEAWAAVLDAVARRRPGDPAATALLPAEELARVAWALQHTPVRDRALGLALGPDAAAAEVLWTECTRRAPCPLDAAPATLLAVCAWLRGDGAMANVALEHALGSDEGYELARLLAQGLAECLPPDELRKVITGTLGRLGETATAG